MLSCKPAVFWAALHNYRRLNRVYLLFKRSWYDKHHHYEGQSVLYNHNFSLTNEASQAMQ